MAKYLDLSTVRTVWTDYAVYAPRFLIDFLEAAINGSPDDSKNPVKSAGRDIRGLFSSQDEQSSSIEAIRVTGEHPMVSLTGALIKSGHVDKVKYATFLPAISVSATMQKPEVILLGQDSKGYQTITQDQLNQIKASTKDLSKRESEGLLTNHQIDIMQSVIDERIEKFNSADFLAYKVTTYQRESYSIGIWTQHLEQLWTLSALMRSVLHELRYVLSGKNVYDTTINDKSQGLVNTNFARILHGEETKISFINWFSTVYVLDQQKIGDFLDANGNLPVDCQFKFSSNSEVDFGNSILDPPGEPFIPSEVTT